MSLNVTSSNFVRENSFGDPASAPASHLGDNLSILINSDLPSEMQSLIVDHLDIIQTIQSNEDLLFSNSNQNSLIFSILAETNSSGLTIIMTPTMPSLRRIFHTLGFMEKRIGSFDLAPTKIEKKLLWEAIERRAVSTLVVTPGRLASKRFRMRIGNRPIARIIVDSADCMSPWSHRFSPTYRMAGKILASIRGASQSDPQIIGLFKNNQSKTLYDFGKLLQLRAPKSMGPSKNLAAKVSVHYLKIDSELDRNQKVSSLLDTSHIRRVIYCNSIRQVSETTEFLSKQNVSFGVMRPGLSELESGSVKSRFCAGDICTMVVIGPFLGQLDYVPYIDSIIFRGMPDSFEMISEEISQVESLGSTKVFVLGNEKDYFHHRFLIDKNYPDTLLLRACVNCIRDVFGKRSNIAPEALATHVKMAIPYPADDIDQCLQALIREGILSVVTDHDTQEKSVELNVSSDEESDFWHEYPSRKFDSLARLEKIRELILKA